jgi:transposase
MAIVAGLEVHRAQITFDALDEETGEVVRGRIQATPEAVQDWAGRFAGEEVDVAVEAGTGWLFVCEALAAAGATPHLAEPVETSALRGKQRRAKSDRGDARWLCTLLAEGRLPEAWIPPAHVREWRTRARLRKTLVDERTSRPQRVQATLFQPRRLGRPGQAAERPGPRVPGRARAARRGQAADRGGAFDDRGARPPARPQSSKRCAGWPAARPVAGR